jgi:hypothetical protein
MRLRPLSLISIGCALVALGLRAQFQQNKAASATSHSQVSSQTPTEFRRDSVFTYLTIPEWDLVWSPDEYADFIAEQRPSDFPYVGHLRQFWQGYGAVYDVTKDEYEFNTDYHTMIVVIGTSTTVEYGLKGGYENSVGRVTEATSLSGMTEEDRLAARVAREYVDFIKVEPWYKFDFVSPLQAVWTDTGTLGPDLLRKWERKYFLTSEYAAKAAYGWAIKQASESAYGVEKPVTAVVLDNFPENTRIELPEVADVKRLPNGSVLALVPRYHAFTKHAQALARAGSNFVEIAGNQGEIAISAIVPMDYNPAGLTVMLKQPILTRPGLQRIYFTVPVSRLASMLRENDNASFQLEHIYDY